MPNFPKLPKDHVYIGTGDRLKAYRFLGHRCIDGGVWKNKVWHTTINVKDHYCVHKDHLLAKTHGHPPPPWDKAPEGTTHRVQNANGEWFWLINATQDPEPFDDGWTHYSKGKWSLCNYNTGPNPAWRDTMERKPKTLLNTVHDLPDPPAGSRILGLGGPHLEKAYPEGFRGYIYDKNAKIWTPRDPKKRWTSSLTQDYYAIIEDNTMNDKPLSQYDFPLFDITDEEALFLRKADYTTGLCRQAEGREELKQKISNVLGDSSYIIDYMRKQGVPDSINNIDIRTEWVRQLLERHEGALSADYIGPAINTVTNKPTMLHPKSTYIHRCRCRRMTPAEWAHYVEGKPMLKRGQLIAVRDDENQPWSIACFDRFHRNSEVRTSICLDGSHDVRWNHWRHLTEEEWTKLREGDEV